MRTYALVHLYRRRGKDPLLDHRFSPFAKHQTSTPPLVVDLMSYLKINRIYTNKIQLSLKTSVYPLTVRVLFSCILQ